MAKNNKGNHPERTPQEDEQIQDILAQYNQIAKSLASSRNEEQIGDVLSPIFDMSDAAQIGLLKALAKEHTIPAADIVFAVNTYAPVKEVRKEARRSLIQLESSNTYPEWTIPSVMSLSDIISGIDPFSSLEDDEDYDEETLDGENVIERFLKYWGQRDFEIAYDLLATNSPLREGLTSEEWSARREAWATEAEPASVKVDVGYTLDVDIEDLPDGLDDGTEELDAFWSLEMKNVPSGSSIPELPTATMTLPATGRHWFWVSYTFVTEDDELRIQSIRDKGAEALQLTPEDAKDRLEEIAEEIQAMSEALIEDEVESDESDDSDDEENDSDIDEDDESEDEVEDEEELEVDIDEVRWFTKQALHYCDALIASTPEENATYELAAKQATVIGETERAIAYLTLAAERLPEERADILRSLGTEYAALATEDTVAHLELEEELEEDEDAVPAEFTSRYFPLAEKAFKDAIAIDNAFSNYILLADLYVGQNKQIDEAKALFEQAEELAENPNQRAAVMLGRAQLAQLEEKPEEALALYQHAADLATDIPGVWNSIGNIQLSLEQKEAAEKSFLKSIEVDPATSDAYAELATLYIDQNNDAAAIQVLERGIDTNPLAADIKAALAMLYINAGDLGKAEELIEEAEEIDPEMEIVYVVRQVIDLQKLQLQQQQRSSNAKSDKSKKKR